jgi:Ni,Fe-hydrogenase III component G
MENGKDKRKLVLEEEYQNGVFIFGHHAQDGKKNSISN